MVFITAYDHRFYALFSDEPHISHTSKPNRNKSKMLRLQFYHVYCWDIIVASVNLTIITGQIDFVITRTETWENPDWVLRYGKCEVHLKKMHGKYG
jgi:hypothetical protein